MQELKFKLEVYEGPLDLMLSLIAKHKLNIYDIEISLLLEQFMLYLDRMKQADIEIAGEFLEMAARLIYIKSAALLPKHEAEEMKKELMQKGVPEKSIYLDYAGFRTLDSVVRAKEVFGQTRLTIISQRFHNERAIYLAEKNGITAIGFNARDVDVYAGLKTNIRELFARVKMFIDLAIDKQPHFLGEKYKLPSGK